VTLPLEKRPEAMTVAIAMFQAVVRGASIKAAGIDLGLSYSQADTRFWQASRIVLRHAWRNSISMPAGSETTMAGYRAHAEFWIELSDAVMASFVQKP
jgi:hypothetical protein